VTLCLRIGLCRTGTGEAKQASKGRSALERGEVGGVVHASFVCNRKWVGELKGLTLRSCRKDGRKWTEGST